MNKDKLEEQINLSIQLGLFNDAHNLDVALNHAERTIKTESGVKIRSKWKGEQAKETCDRLVPTKGWKSKRMPKTIVINGKFLTYTPEPHKECGKPLTHVVSWEIDRWYGKKHAEDAFCQKHAEAFVKSLNEHDIDFCGKERNFEPITIRRL